MCAGRMTQEATTVQASSRRDIREGLVFAQGLVLRLALYHRHLVILVDTLRRMHVAV